jgi:hypothetical protein
MVRFMLRSGKYNRFYSLYTGSNFYWFPEHSDHDGEDLAYYMVPFTNSSQGSSGTEMEEVEKWFYTLAAFSAETKLALEESGTLMPTIQMLFRRTRVETDSDYLTGLAHANAFEDNENGHKMVRMANLMEPDTTPPMVQLDVVEETWSDDEVEFTTEVAVARHWKGDETQPRSITVDASDSFDPNGYPLSYHWTVIRGDPEAVRIALLDPEGSTATIELDWHEEEVLMIGSEERISTLAVVGVFVHNGVYFSAPAFVSSSTSDDR